MLDMSNAADKPAPYVRPDYLRPTYLCDRDDPRDYDLSNPAYAAYIDHIVAIGDKDDRGAPVEHPLRRL